MNFPGVRLPSPRVYPSEHFRSVLSRLVEGGESCCLHPLQQLSIYSQRSIGRSGRTLFSPEAGKPGHYGLRPTTSPADRSKESGLTSGRPRNNDSKQDRDEYRSKSSKFRRDNLGHLKGKYDFDDRSGRDGSKGGGGPVHTKGKGDGAWGKDKRKSRKEDKLRKNRK